MNDDDRRLTPDELAAQQQQWGCIRNVAVAAFGLVLVGLVVGVLLTGGDDDEGAGRVVVAIPDADFSVDVRLEGDEPMAVIKNGGQIQVHHLVNADGVDVGYCSDAEVFVARDQSIVYDLDGVALAEAPGLDRYLFEPGEGEIDIDLGFIDTPGGQGVIPRNQVDDPDVVACVESVADLDYATAE